MPSNRQVTGSSSTSTPANIPRMPTAVISITRWTSTTVNYTVIPVSSTRRSNK
jgi:hypothetical protein